MLATPRSGVTLGPFSAFVAFAGAVAFTGAAGFAGASELTAAALAAGAVAVGPAFDEGAGVVGAVVFAAFAADVLAGAESTPVGL
ncbi:hypothetical protein GCM10009682_07030 [Luedemannella flava]|uniref:Uncharacterized protein n=1 Tax=Luedemannella flava TaxID=349316 RepID=A0ABP4XSF9_9ACTN